MSDFNNVVNMVRDVARIATKKTGTAVEISKLKLQIMQLRSQMQSTYERIGILTYEQQKTDADNQELILICIKEIDSLLGRISDVNAGIAAVKDGVKCPNCGVVNPFNTVYCENCGINISRTQQ